MNYYFSVKETKKHDQELAVIEADNLEEAKKEFTLAFPEDKNNIVGISSDIERVATE